MANIKLVLNWSNGKSWIGQMARIILLVDILFNTLSSAIIFGCESPSVCHLNFLVRNWDILSDATNYLVAHALLNPLVHHRELHIWTDEYILEGIHIRFERQQNKEFSFELQNPHFQCKCWPAMVVMPPASTARAQASYPDSRPGRNSKNTVDPLIKTCFQVSKWNQREKKGIFRCPDFFVSKFEMFTKLIQSYDQLKSISCFTSIPLSKKWPVSQSTLDEVHICRNKCKMDIYAELWT